MRLSLLKRLLLNFLELLEEYKCEVSLIINDSYILATLLCPRSARFAGNFLESEKHTKAREMTGIK